MNHGTRRLSDKVLTYTVYRLVLVISFNDLVVAGFI